MQFLLVAVIIFFGIVAHTILGFGVALICMPLLIRVLDPSSSAALVSLFTLPLQLIIIWRYRHALNIRPFWRVLVGSLIGIPIGVILIAHLDQQLILTALGLFLIAYALYSLLNLRLPALRRPAWSFGFGFASGVLSGAYNTGGPPMVIYGTTQGWNSAEFKANLQALFTVASVLVIASHVVTGHITVQVLEHTVIALPVTVVGTATGFWLSRYVNEAQFRKAVLVLLLIIGVRLLFP